MEMTATATKERVDQPAVRGSATFDRLELLRACSKALRVIPRRPLIPTAALGWLRVHHDGYASLRATDPMRGLWLDLDLDASAPGQVFETLLPVREWIRTLAAMDSETVTIRSDGDVVYLEHGDVSFTWKVTRRPEDMPQWPTFTARGSATPPPGALLQAFQRALFSVSPDDTRPVLACLYLATGSTGRRLVSADGFRLTSTPFPWADELGDVLIPSSAANLVVSMLRTPKPKSTLFEVSESGSMVRFEIGSGCVLHAQAVVGSFPNYEQLIPETFGTTVTLPAPSVSRALRMLEQVALEGSRIVRMHVGPDGLTVESRDDDGGTGRVRLLAAVEGPPIRTALNWRYFTDVAAAIDGDLRLELPVSPANQMVFRSVSEPDFVQVVMPMYVQWGDE